MAYEDKDFTPSTGSMMPSHTETQIKNFIHLKGTFSSGIKHVSTVGLQLSILKKRLREIAAEKHDFCSCMLNYIINMANNKQK